MSAESCRRALHFIVHVNVSVSPLPAAGPLRPHPATRGHDSQAELKVTNEITCLSLLGRLKGSIMSEISLLIPANYSQAVIWNTELSCFNSLDSMVSINLIMFLRLMFVQYLIIWTDLDTVLSTAPLPTNTCLCAPSFLCRDNESILLKFSFQDYFPHQKIKITKIK